MRTKQELMSPERGRKKERERESEYRVMWELNALLWICWSGCDGAYYVNIMASEDTDKV